MTTHLSDFEIQAAAEVGACGDHGSFRAMRRADRLPVLLHRFRPADTIHDICPATSAVPDFDLPFVTSITDVVTAAGSVYLVEPLPTAVPVAKAWRAVLIQAPEPGSSRRVRILAGRR